MKLDQDEVALLGVHEDDWYGLWEVDWYFNGARPEWPHDKRSALLIALLQQGLVDVFFGRLMTYRRPLPREVALKRLVDPEAWTPPSNGQETGYYVAISSAGVAALESTP